MPAIGAEVADAYIEVHASTGPFRRELRREATLAAREASDEFGTEFTKAIDRDLDPLGAKISDALRDAGELGGQNLIEEIAEQVRARANRINSAFAQSLTFGDFSPFIEQFNEMDDAIEEFDSRLRELNKDGTLTNETFDRLNASFNAYVRTLQDSAIADALRRDREESIAFEKQAERLTRALDDSGTSVRKFNIGLGQLKGSRNDFLNFVGSLAGFLERNIGKGLQGMFQGIGNGVSFLGQKLADVNGPLGSIGKRMDGFGASISKLGAGGLDGLIIQIAAFSLAIQGLIAVIGPLTAGISGLLSAIISLALGVGGALLGGIVALGPALAALALGAGSVAIGFTGLSKSQKAVFKPLVELFKTIRDAIQGRLFDGLGDQVNGLLSALGAAGPFLVDLAGVFRDWVNDVVKEIGPGGPLDATFKSLGEDLPGIFRTLLDLVSAVGGSLTGLFAAAAPGAQRLFQGLTGVVEQFSAWVNTSEGQQAINSFLQQAVDLLGTLFDIASEVGKTLGLLWEGGGQEAAQELLTVIRNIVISLNEFLSDPGNREQLLEFFRNGVSVARELGEVVGALITFFASLDTEFNRLAFTTVINGVTTVIEKFTEFAAFTQRVVRFIIILVAAAIRLATVLGNLGARAAAAGAAFRTALIDAFLRVNIAIGNFANRVRDGFRRVNIAIGNLSNRAIDGFRNFNIAIGNAVNAVIRFVQRVGVRFKVFLSSMRNIFEGVRVVLNNVVQSASRALSRFIEIIRVRLLVAFLRVRNFVQGIRIAFSDFASSIGRGVSRAIESVRLLASRVISALTGLPGRLEDIGSDMMQGLRDGIVNKGEGILDYLRDLAARAAAAFTSVLGIESPSKVFTEYGRNIVEGLVQGIDSGIGDVLAATNTLAGAAGSPALNSSVSDLANQTISGTGSSSARSGTNVGGITIVTPFANPRLVALEVMDELAARGK